MERCLNLKVYRDYFHPFIHNNKKIRPFGIQKRLMFYANKDSEKIVIFYRKLTV